MQILNDTIDFLKTLSFVDIIFYFSVLALMLLIITLIHFILENKDEEPSVIIENDSISKKEEPANDEMDNLLKIAEALSTAEPNSNLNHYEEEQEEKAIISYDELLERTNEYAINYAEEENVADDLTIKKVDLNNLVNKEVSIKPNIKVEVISYEKEEAFLKALKELQQLLN